ncbi:hemolysin family protein [Ignavibacteriales bacterium]
MSTELVLFLGLLGCFIVSALFSGSEVALFGTDKSLIKRGFHKNPLLLRYSLFLIENPKRLLVTILLGNNLVNTLASILAVAITILTANRFAVDIESALTIQIATLTILVLLFGEISPKVFATHNPIGFLRISIFPLYWVSLVLYPASELINEFVNFAFGRLKLNKSKLAINQEDISQLADIGHKAGTLAEKEHEIIKGLVSYINVSVKQVMRPRVDIVAVPQNSTLDEVATLILDAGHSRLPVYKDDLDKITGILYAKDLLPLIKSKMIRNRSLFTPAKLARPAMFVPETKLISELMQEFQEKKLHMAIVIDEYGGTSGLITLEDILEEILGDIRDEYDKEEPTINKIGSNLFEVSGELTIGELEELLEVEFGEISPDIQTISGLIFENAGKIPKAGFSIIIGPVLFKVVGVERNRLRKILVRRQ